MQQTAAIPKAKSPIGAIGPATAAAITPTASKTNHSGFSANSAAIALTPMSANPASPSSFNGAHRSSATNLHYCRIVTET